MLFSSCHHFLKMICLLIRGPDFCIANQVVSKLFATWSKIKSKVDVG